ncbi:unnamed protein product [Prunus armeniaca]|uniref:Uncharacterized protein n=1 Tax=Prunus armeniaca TaxID=36596 RepID=A0A6J5XIE2_PRUAR|nr:unnamed protein product [Prunus armeniaca]
MAPAKAEKRVSGLVGSAGSIRAHAWPTELPVGLVLNPEALLQNLLQYVHRGILMQKINTRPHYGDTDIVEAQGLILMRSKPGDRVVYIERKFLLGTLYFASKVIWDCLPVRNASVVQSEVPDSLNVSETIVVQSGVDKPARARTVPEV